MVVMAQRGSVQWTVQWLGIDSFLGGVLGIFQFALIFVLGYLCFGGF